MSEQKHINTSKKQFDFELSELYGEKELKPTQQSETCAAVAYDLWRRIKLRRKKLTLPVQVLPLSGETLIAEMLIRNKLSELNIDVEFT